MHAEYSIDKTAVVVEIADQNTDQKITLLQLVGTVLCAALGVQSSKNCARDFANGKASTFVIAGITFSLLFITTLSSLVHIVLKQAGH